MERISLQFFKRKYIPFWFSQIAQEIIQIPSTEAPVERVFGALSQVTSTEMCNVDPETLNARLIVKFDTIFAKATNIYIDDLLNDPALSLKLKKYPQLGY